MTENKKISQIQDMFIRLGLVLGSFLFLIIFPFLDFGSDSFFFFTLISILALAVIFTFVLEGVFAIKDWITKVNIKKGRFKK